jgi:hypothetical protein
MDNDRRDETHQESHPEKSTSTTDSIPTLIEEDAPSRDKKNIYQTQPNI